VIESVSVSSSVDNSILMDSRLEESFLGLETFCPTIHSNTEWGGIAMMACPGGDLSGV
jgi:hypothetical protein